LSVVCSLPLLVGILFIYSSLGSLCFCLLGSSTSLVGGLFYVYIIFAFLVKIPIFIVHLWLPKAHVEAPVSLQKSLRRADQSSRGVLPTVACRV
jgi:NADH-ubiquinone oxidoreductase chain 4